MVICATLCGVPAPGLPWLPGTGATICAETRCALSPARNGALHARAARSWPSRYHLCGAHSGRTSAAGLHGAGLHLCGLHSDYAGRMPVQEVKTGWDGPGNDWRRGVAPAATIRRGKVISQGWSGQLSELAIRNQPRAQVFGSKKGCSENGNSQHCCALIYYLERIGWPAAVIVREAFSRSDLVSVLNFSCFHGWQGAQPCHIYAPVVGNVGAAAAAAVSAEGYAGTSSRHGMPLQSPSSQVAIDVVWLLPVTVTSITSTRLRHARSTS